jgi:hypothetical protein
LVFVVSGKQVDDLSVVFLTQFLIAHEAIDIGDLFHIEQEITRVLFINIQGQKKLLECFWVLFEKHVAIPNVFMYGGGSICTLIQSSSL